jgi:threonine dehydrogenase-like Zn-dependent dehydrogenase
MKALCYQGINRLKVETVEDPRIINAKDVILRVTRSSVCGSDLHFIHGYIPFMRKGDILGHEFTGEVVETGSGVQTLKKGDRVVVAPDIGCGHCYFCESGEWSLCDNSNQNGFLQDKITGYPSAAFFGSSHLMGGYAGSHAEYIRVPYAESGCFKIPEELTWEQALFASDALPTGYMAADQAVNSGDIVAIWGAGGVGQLAAASAWMKGASRVLIIDKYDYRLSLAAKHTSAEVLNYRDTDILEVLKEATGGRGPDVCIDAVGMEADSTGVGDLYDRGKQKLRLQTDRPGVLRQIIRACRKGGTIFVAGVYTGFIDKFPIGPLLIKSLTVKSGLVHAQQYIPALLSHIKNGDIDPSFLKTHQWTLEQGAEGYRKFSDDRNNILRGVFAFT